MSDIETPPGSFIIIDKITQKVQEGDFTGGIITKLTDPEREIIFSDNFSVKENQCQIKGLHIGFNLNKVHSTEHDVMTFDISSIDYAVILPVNIVQEYDKARLSTSFPNIIRFLHTTCLYHTDSNEPINHLDLVAGEILNRPIAVTMNNGIILGDRLVVDEDFQLIFYDCIIIGQPTWVFSENIEEDMHNMQIQTIYEHFTMIPLSKLKYIILLGTENF